jgi:hypothetical protein
MVLITVFVVKFLIAAIMLCGSVSDGFNKKKLRRWNPTPIAQSLDAYNSKSVLLYIMYHNNESMQLAMAYHRKKSYLDDPYIHHKLIFF